KISSRISMILGYVLLIPSVIYSIVLLTQGVMTNSLLASLGSEGLAITLLVLFNVALLIWVLAGHSLAAFGTDTKYRVVLTITGVMLVLVLLPVGIMVLIGIYSGKDENTEPKKYNWLRLQYNKFYIIMKNGISEQNPIVITVLG